MRGWKTKLAGASAITWAVTGYFLGIHDIDFGVDMVVQGLAILGIGHKIDRISSGS